MKAYLLSVEEMPRTSIFTATESRLVVTRGWDGGNGERQFVGMGFHLGDENVMGLDTGAGCTPQG